MLSARAAASARSTTAPRPSTTRTRRSRASSSSSATSRPRRTVERERKRYEEQLTEADRRKDEFLATLAHELRGPLAPLRSALDVMKLRRIGRT
jgi:signal transduction histidine kinase